METKQAGNPKHLYLYSGLVGGERGWFASATTFRAAFPRAKFAVRCAHQEVDAPVGYRKTGRGLAREPVERIPTMRSFVQALTPRGAK